MEVAHRGDEGDAAPRDAVRAGPRAHGLGVRDDLERGLVPAGDPEARLGVRRLGGWSGLDRVSRNGTFSILLLTGRVRRVDRRGLLGGGRRGLLGRRGRVGGSGRGLLGFDRRLSHRDRRVLFLAHPGGRNETLLVVQITRSKDQSSPASHGDRRAIRGPSGVGRPRGVLGHARALPRAAGAQGRAFPSVARTFDRVAMDTTALLALSVARVHAAPRSTDALVALAMNGIITLACNGSQSNHVLLELAMCAAVLLCAPSVTSGRRRASSTEMDPSRARRAFSRRLTFSTRAALCVLYATTGFAKLNDDWHDPNVSCCVQMLVGALSGMGLDARHVSVVAPERLRAFIPYAATAFELGFPLLCVTSTCRIFGGRGFCHVDGGAPTTVRLLTAVGASFHALIAMPPPPMSVYPFSMIMAPMYVAGAVPHETGVAASAFAARWKSGGASFRARCGRSRSSPSPSPSSNMRRTRTLSIPRISRGSWARSGWCARSAP